MPEEYPQGYLKSFGYNPYQISNTTRAITPEFIGAQTYSGGTTYGQDVQSGQAGGSNWLGDHWQNIAGGALGLIGTLGAFNSTNNSMPNLPDLPFSKEDIDSLIASKRQQGNRAIGGQLSQANIGTAGNLASRGLGSSTIVAGALQGNQQQAIASRQNLESSLNQEQMDMLQQLYRMQYEQEMAKWQAQQSQNQNKFDIFGTLADVGGLLLL